MKERFEKIWKLAVPYLRKGKRKDFVIHTKGVIKAMQLLIKQQGGDENILIPAAILHDTGWSKVPLSLQKSRDKAKTRKAMELHLKYITPVIRKVLTEVNFDKKKNKDNIRHSLGAQISESKGPKQEIAY